VVLANAVVYICSEAFSMIKPRKECNL